MRSSEFNRLHPLTVFVYFLILLCSGAFVIQPVFITLSFCGAACFALKLSGPKLLKKSPLMLFPLLLATAVNTLFNHRGVTVLLKLPSGNSVTLEALVYGLITGFMLCSVMIWFYCFGKLFTSEKLMCLTGKLFPALTVIISMTIRFIPLFVRRFHEVRDAQEQLGFGIKGGSIRQKLKNLSRIFSILLTRSLEESIETADSMKSRGYGIPGRSSFNMFRFKGRDIFFIITALFLGAYIIYGEITGLNEFRCYPRFYFSSLDFWSVMQILAFGILCFIPVAYELLEDMKWKLLLSRT